MSKANQAFNTNDEAVSPVIGVILMVAITVVLAAVVFVLVSNLGESSESAPDIAFQADESDNSIRVIRAENNLEWGDFEVTATGCTLASVDTTSEDVSAGDSFTCANAGTVRIRHIESNSLVFEREFST